MKKQLICLGLALALSACNATDVLNTDLLKNKLLNKSDSKISGNHLKIDNSHQLVTNTWRPSHQNIPGYAENINSYVRGMMQDLLANLQYVGEGTPVAVADFVYLNSDFTATNLLGKQLAEAFSHEVHKLGIPVVDYKLTDYIRVTPAGSTAMTKDYLELSGNIPIRYILTGTLVEDRTGIIVNARIVGIESKAIVASAQGILPPRVTDALSVELSNDGLTY